MKANIEQILEDYKNGKMIILLDDEDRENEGDLIIAAEKVTDKDINFMATFGKGLICLTLTEKRCSQLKLPLMVGDNKDANGTNFTVSIEAASGVTTGISAADRAKTVIDAVAKNANEEDIVQPGHIFPLMAKKGGVLTRAGHTEAGCDLARLAGFEPASVIVEILNEDGTMARRPDLEIFAEKHNIKWGTIEDLINYRLSHEKTIEQTASENFTTKYGEFLKVEYLDSITGKTHTALIKGRIGENTNIRVHMQNYCNDVLRDNSVNNNSLSVDKSLKYISENGGVLVLLSYGDSNTKNDIKTFGVGAQILSSIGVSGMNILISKGVNTHKLNAIKGFGLTVNKHIEI
jgi:3,4-dihydroxy 2-butanone 4-phosphate synthase/GTP cyclohydrolase II